jgi:dephospho-CoA kinase
MKLPNKNQNKNQNKDQNQQPNFTPQSLDSWIKRRCIGLTGGIATGKSTVAKILRELGYAVADADQFARLVTAPGSPTLAAIVSHFGANILHADQSLNRERLRELVMPHPEARRVLESIMHPAIHNELRAWVANHIEPVGEKPFFYEASLIFETKRESAFWQVWATLCPENIQIKRLMDRSGLSREAAIEMIAAQMPAGIKATKAHLIIDTDCSVLELRQKVEDLVKTIHR